MVYMVILLCYDYTGGGFRYLLPVLPFGLVYFAVALLFFIKHAGISKKVFVVCSIALVLIAYNYDWQKIYDNMMKPAFVFDGRNLLDKAKLEKIGFQYAYKCIAKKKLR